MFIDRTVFMEKNLVQGQYSQLQAEADYFANLILVIFPESRDGTPCQKKSDENPAIKSLHVKYSENKEGF